MRKQMYLIRKGHCLAPKNKLQKAFMEESGTWSNYVVESLDEFGTYMQVKADLIRERYPRCGRLHVVKANRVSDGKWLIWINDIMCMEAYELAGRWGTKMGFQPFIELEGGERL